MGIRQKVFRALVLPLAIFAGINLILFSLFFIQGRRNIAYQNRLKKSALEKTYADLERQTLAYAKLAASSLDLMIGVENDFRHYVMRVILPLHETLKTDFIIVHERDGYVIGKSHQPEIFGAEEGRNPIVRAALAGNTVRGIRQIENRFAILTALPVVYNERVVGVCAVGYFLEKDFALRLKGLVGAEVFIVKGDKILTTSFPDELYAGGKLRLRPGHRLRYKWNVYDVSYAPLADGKEKIGIFLAVDNTLMHRTVFAIFIVSLLVTVVIIAVAVRFGWRFSLALAAPVVEVSQQAERVARGDLSVEPLEAVSRDETGRLAASFNTMVGNLRGLMEQDRSRREYLEGEVSRLLEVIEAAAAGDLSRTFSAESDDEIAKIGDALNRMMADLNEHIAADRRQREYLETQVAKLLDVMVAAAAGDLSKRFPVETADAIGSLGKGLNSMIANLNQMLERDQRQREYLERQVAKLLETIQNIAAGDFSAKFEAERDDEFGQIGAAIVHMAFDIKAMIDQIGALKQEDHFRREYLETQTREILAAVSTAARGDLTAPLARDSSDALIADLKANLNSMLESLRLMIGKVRESARQVEQASGTLGGISAKLAKGAGSQLESIQGASREIGDMLGSLDEVARRSDTMMNLSRRASEQARSGGETISHSLVGMDSISGAMDDIQLVMRELETSAEEIEEIVKVIDDIADQTNLLALNASIEAARAGEFGKGFSVVAKEVGSLAQRSVVSTREITAIVRKIQERVSNAMQSTRTGIKVVAEGHRHAIESGEALNRILDSVDQMTGHIKDTVESLESQRGRSATITGAIAKVSGIAEESAGIVRAAAAAVESLTALAAELDTLVRQFRIDRER